MKETKDALWIKRGGALVAADHATKATLDAMKEGTWVRTSAPKPPRNPKHHRYMMAMLNKVVEQTWPQFVDMDHILKWLKWNSGMVEKVYVAEGMTVVTLPSISFMDMDENEFRALAKKWRELISEKLLNGADPEDLLRETRE